MKQEAPLSKSNFDAVLIPSYAFGAGKIRMGYSLSRCLVNVLLQERGPGGGLFAVGVCCRSSLVDKAAITDAYRLCKFHFLARLATRADKMLC
jgi:hypothetical protein